MFMLVQGGTELFLQSKNKITSYPQRAACTSIATISRSILQKANNHCSFWEPYKTARTLYIGRKQLYFMLRHVIPAVITELQKVKYGQEVCQSLLNLFLARISSSLVIKVERIRKYYVGYISMDSVFFLNSH